MGNKIPELRKRVGRIKISIVVLEDYTDDVQKIFEKFIPFRAEAHYHGGGGEIEYMGYSKEFDVIGEGEIVPEYTVEITKIDYKVTISFKRLPQDTIISSMELEKQLAEIKAQGKKEQDAKASNTEHENREDKISV